MPQMESPPLQDSDESPIEDDIEQLFRGVVKHLCLTLHHSLPLYFTYWKLSSALIGRWIFWSGRHSNTNTLKFKSTRTL